MRVKNRVSGKALEYYLDKPNSLKEWYVASLCIYFFCLPLNVIRVGGLGSLTRFLAFFPIIISLIFNAKIKISLSIGWLSFSFFAFCSMAWTISFLDSAQRVLSDVLLACLLLSGGGFYYDENDIRKLKNALINSSRFTAIIMLATMEYRQGRFFLGGIIVEDPNYLCAYFIFGAANDIQNILERIKEKKPILYFFELLCYGALIFMSGSRGGAVAVFAGLSVYLFAIMIKSKKVFLRGVIILIIVIVGIAFILQKLPDDLRERFTIQNIINSGGSHRIEIWSNGIDLFKKSSVFRKLFGYGTATIRVCFEKYNYSIVNVMHNIFLETLIEMGIIGLSIYVIMILAFFIVAMKIRDKFALACFVCMFVLSLSTSLYTFKPYFNTMLFLIILKYSKKLKTKI